MSENILLDSLPETVKVNGKEFSIDSDFRTCIILEKILDNKSLDSKHKVIELLDLFYGEDQPDSAEAAVGAIMKFYCCGEEPSKAARPKKNGNVEIKPKMIYSFEHDASYIFSAFLTQYGIDLNEIEYLHWWKFQALFRSLNDSNKIVEIMGYRAANLGEISNKKERERIAKLKRIYALPENLSREDKIARAGASFGGGFM